MTAATRVWPSGLSATSGCGVAMRLGAMATLTRTVPAGSKKRRTLNCTSLMETAAQVSPFSILAFSTCRCLYLRHTTDAEDAE